MKLKIMLFSVALVIALCASSTTVLAAHPPDSASTQLTTGTETAAQPPDSVSTQLTTDTETAAHPPDSVSTQLKTDTETAAHPPGSPSTLFAVGGETSSLTTGTETAAQPPDSSSTQLTAGTETSSTPESPDMSDELSAAGADELYGVMPDDARRLMDDAGVTKIDAKQLLSLSPKDFFSTLWELVLERIKRPLAVFCTVLGTILLCALLDACKTSLWEGTLSTVFSAVSVVCVAAAIVEPIIGCIQSTMISIHDCSNFIVSFIPVFASIVTVGGQAATATTYTAFLFGACQVVSQVVANTLVPLMGIYLAFCIAGNLAPGIDVSAVAKVIKSTVSWALGLLLTLFVGLMSLQTMVASSGDTVASKTAKFLIGSFVPVVGGALSDAFIATQGYMKLLKTTVGAFGILVALMTFLPVFIQTSLWYLTVNITAAVSDMLGVGQVANILKSASATLGVLVAVIICFALLVIVSTSLVLMVSPGV